MNIRGKKITLRAIEKDDCRLIVMMFNDTARIRQMMDHYELI